MKPLGIGSITIEPGTSARTVLGSVRLPSGTAVEIPCMAAHGTQDGPVLVVVGSTHGNEVVGTGAVIRLMQSIDPKGLRGSVIAIPAVNPAAFNQGEYATPQDGRNMASRIYWSPDPMGTMTARLGALVGPVYRMADCLIDLHGNREPCASMSMLFLSSTSDQALRDRVVALGEAFGVTPVDMSDPVAHPGWVGPADQYGAPVAIENGIPALMVELVRAYTVGDAERGRKGVMNVMKSLGMIDGAPEAQEPARLPGRYKYWGSLTTNSAGLLWPRVETGTLVQKGVVVAEITDLFGDVLETIVSPEEGFLWSFNGALYGGGTHALPEGADIGFFAQKV